MTLWYVVISAYTLVAVMSAQLPLEQLRRARRSHRSAKSISKGRSLRKPEDAAAAAAKYSETATVLEKRWARRWHFGRWLYLVVPPVWVVNLFVYHQFKDSPGEDGNGWALTAGVAVAAVSVLVVVRLFLRYRRGEELPFGSVQAMPKWEKGLALAVAVSLFALFMAYANRPLP